MSSGTDVGPGFTVMVVVGCGAPPGVAAARTLRETMEVRARARENIMLVKRKVEEKARKARGNEGSLRLLRGLFELRNQSSRMEGIYMFSCAA